MLIATVFAVLALGLLFPETRIGGAIRRLLVEAPARRLHSLKRGHLLLALVVFAALAVAYLVAREAGVMVAGQAAADGLSFAMAIDVATWLDVTAIALLVAVAVRFREAVRMAAVQARSWTARLVSIFTSLGRGRARRARPTSRPRRGDDKDRPAPGLAWA